MRGSIPGRSRLIHRHVGHSIDPCGEGLVADGLDPSKLQERLRRVVRELLTGVTRTGQDDNGLFSGHDLETLLAADVRDAVIRRVQETATAR